VLRVIAAALVASLAGVLLFPLAFPTLCAIGAVVVGAVLLGSVVRSQWTHAEFAT
jgi:hypothetical protein